MVKKAGASRQHEIDPNHAMRACGIHIARVRRIGGWPMDPGTHHIKIDRRQDILHAQMPRSILGPCHGVKFGIARLTRALKGWPGLFGLRILQARVRQQVLNGFFAALTINGVEIGIAKKNKTRLGRRAKRAIQKKVPKADFIMVAAAISIFGAIENGWSCMEGQEVKKCIAGQDDRHHPMPHG